MFYLVLVDDSSHSLVYDWGRPNDLFWWFRALSQVIAFICCHLHCAYTFDHGGAPTELWRSSGALTFEQCWRAGQVIKLRGWPFWTLLTRALLEFFIFRALGWRRIGGFKILSASIDFVPVTELTQHIIKSLSLSCYRLQIRKVHFDFDAAVFWHTFTEVNQRETECRLVSPDRVLLEIELRWVIRRSDYVSVTEPARVLLRLLELDVAGSFLALFFLRDEESCVERCGLACWILHE